MRPLHSSCNRSSSSKLPTDVLGLALVLLLCLTSSTGSCTGKERSSLLQFLAGLSRDGGLAVSWRNDTDCCTWEGITCNRDATITHVSLASKGLEGLISPSLGDLTGLLHLNLSHNSLSGGFPLEALLSSSSIVVLDVSFNQLSGDLQELQSLATIRPLQVLNDLEGPIPTGGQFDTFQSSSFDGNPNLCGPMLIRHCDSAVEVPASRLSTKQCSAKLIFFAVAFGVFFGVGVLLDQMVLSSIIIFQF